MAVDQGKPFSAPNDVIVHPEGGIWFTDPGYGSMGNYEGCVKNVYDISAPACAGVIFDDRAQTTDNYEPGRDSKPQPGEPKGEILKFRFDSSKIFPGTTREYWVYVPAQYTPEKPACVYVGQDGIKFEAPTVFDNLISRPGKMNEVFASRSDA